MGWAQLSLSKIAKYTEKKIQKNEKSAEIEEFHILPPPSPPLGLKEYKAKSHPHTLQFELAFSAPRQTFKRLVYKIILLNWKMF